AADRTPRPPRLEGSVANIGPTNADDITTIAPVVIAITWVAWFCASAPGAAGGSISGWADFAKRYWSSSATPMATTVCVAMRNRFEPGSDAMMRLAQSLTVSRARLLAAAGA